MRRFPENPEEYRMSLGEHLEELRRRLIYSLVGVGIVTVGCLVFGKDLVAFVTRPVREAAAQLAGNADARLLILTPTEPFVTTVKTAFVVAAVISSPWVLYQVWIFVAAGLYRHERRIVYIFVPFSATLFLAGTVFAYLVVLRYGLGFLLGFAGLTDSIAQASPRLSAAVNFVMMLSVVMGAVFQLPLVMMILSVIGVVKPTAYVKQWRYAIAATFLVSAVLTPPDAFTQVMMAGPMIGLYWLGVLLAKIACRKS